MESLRAAFNPVSQNPGNNQKFVSNYYPFWDMEDGQKAIIRFLPDLNNSNPRGFLEEKIFHTLEINGKKRAVQCLSQYGEECPICKLSQEYYKAGDNVNGKKYWKSRKYVGQALIVDDPLPANEDGEKATGKVRYVSLGYQLNNIIKEAFMSQDDPLEGIPYSFEKGHDFIIKKTQTGQWPSYTSGTKFMSKTRALSEAEVVSAEEGMVELHTLLAKNPGIEKIQALLRADRTGEEYHEDRPATGGRPSAADDSEDDERFEQSKPSLPARPVAKPAASAAASLPFSDGKPVAEKSTAVDGETDVQRMLREIREKKKLNQQQ